MAGEYQQLLAGLWVPDAGRVVGAVGDDAAAVTVGTPSPPRITSLKIVAAVGKVLLVVPLSVHSISTFAVMLSSVSSGNSALRLLVFRLRSNW